MVKEMSGSLDHPPCATGRAEASALTGESYEMFVSAAVAFDPQKTVFQTTTGKVVIELLSDESRQLRTLFRYVAQESR
jgi:hypothetical protein